MHLISRMFSAILLFVPVFAVQAKPVTYHIDPTHSFVLLVRSNYGFSNPCIVASIDQGTLVFDHDNPSKSSVRVTLPVAKINTFVPQLNKEFQSSMFFDARRFPTITFKSTHVQYIGHDSYTVAGKLTVHGVTRLVMLHARLNKIGKNPMTGKPAIGFDATGSLMRSDFGLGFNAPGVSDKISLRITMQADASH